MNKRIRKVISMILFCTLFVCSSNTLVFAYDETGETDTEFVTSGEETTVAEEGTVANEDPVADLSAETKTVSDGEPSGPDYTVSVEGFGEGDSFVVSYSYDNSNWTYPVTERVDDPNINAVRFILEEVPNDFDGGDIVYIKLTGHSNQPAKAFITCSLFDWNTVTEVLTEQFEGDGVSCTTDGDNDGFYITVAVPYSHILLDPEVHDRRLNVMADYIDAGSSAIIDEANDYIYAYSAAQGKTIPDKLAEELYNRFIDVPMFGQFGIWDENRDTGINNLKTRIGTVGDPYTASAEKADGSSVNVPVQDYEITWGNDSETGEPVTQILPVYTLTGANDILVCTDFSEDEYAVGRGNTYYLRSPEDTVHFTDDQGYPAEGAVIYDNYETYESIVAGGNGRGTFVLNKDGLYSLDCSSFYINEDLTAFTIRVMRPTGTYIVLKGEGEDLAYGNIGENGFATDVVWATGEDATANVYIGDSTVYLEQLGTAVDGVSHRAVTGIELLDSDYLDGVSIDATNLAKIKLTFASNFYDSVPLSIIYEGGFEEKLTIHRIGLVIGYQYLSGPTDHDEGAVTGTISPDYRNDIAVEYQYNYFEGQQIIITATYYHPSNDQTASGGENVSLFLNYDDGRTDVLEKTAYKAPGNGGVACTTFIIGFANAKTFDGNVWTDDITEQEYGGFHATVVNSGYDDMNTYSGTQAGSGEGVYWDGVIKWFD